MRIFGIEVINQFRVLKKVTALIDDLLGESIRLAQLSEQGKWEDECRAISHHFRRTYRHRDVLYKFMFTGPAKLKSFDFQMFRLERAFRIAIQICYRFHIDGVSERTSLEVGSLRGRGSAQARWSKLDPVKTWAFEQRAKDAAKTSRAAFIRSILPEVRELAKSAGTPLTGSEEAVERTVTRWFRDAGIP